jgi:hypothetical protein
MNIALQQKIEAVMNRDVPYEGLSNRKSVEAIDRKPASEESGNPASEPHWSKPAMDYLFEAEVALD